MRREGERLENCQREFSWCIMPSDSAEGNEERKVRAKGQAWIERMNLKKSLGPLVRKKVNFTNGKESVAKK